jgi:hypothetical protein
MNHEHAAHHDHRRHRGVPEPRAHDARTGMPSPV